MASAGVGSPIGSCRRSTGSWLVITPGQKPKLVFLQPFDYWHVVPSAPIVMLPQSPL